MEAVEERLCSLEALEVQQWGGCVLFAGRVRGAGDAGGKKGRIARGGEGGGLRDARGCAMREDCEIRGDLRDSRGFARNAATTRARLLLIRGPCYL